MRTLPGIIAIFALATALLAPVVIDRPAIADESASGFREVARLPFAPHSITGTQELPSTILLNIEERTGFRIIGGKTQSNAEPTTITRFNLDTLKDGPTKAYPTISGQTNGGSAENDLIAALGGGKIYLVDNTSAVRVIDQKTLEEVAWFPPPLPTLGTATNAVPSGGGGGFDFDGWLDEEACKGSTGVASADCLLTAPDHLNTDPPDTSGTKGLTQRRPVSNIPVRIGALEFFPTDSEGGGKLMVLTESPNDGTIPVEGPQVVALSQWDAETGFEDWVAHLDACRSGRGPQKPKYGLGLSVVGVPDQPELKEAIVGCISRGAAGEVWRVRFEPVDTLHLDEGLADELQPVKAQTKVADVPGALDFYIDAKARRVHVQTSGAVSGQTFTAVDLDRGGVYGLVFVSHLPDNSNDNTASVSAGLDPKTGRLYSIQRHTEQSGRVNEAGVLLVDARRQPLPQGNLLPELSLISGDQPIGRSGINRVRVDPATKDRPARVYLRFRGEDFIRIFEDRVPVREDIPLGDVDRFTLDLPEGDDTRAAFNATTNSYGVRSILVGGLYATIPTMGSFGTAQLPRDALQGDPSGTTGAPFGCESERREVVLADLTPGGNGLSDTGVTADAIPVSADSKTIQDGGRPAAACWPTAGLIPTTVDNASGDEDGNPTVNDLLQTLFGEDGIGKNPPETGPFPPPWPEGPPDNDLFHDDDNEDGEVDEHCEDEEEPGIDCDENESDPDELWGQTIRDPFPYSSAACSAPGRSDSAPHEGDDLTITAGGIHLADDPPPGFIAGVECSEDGRSVTAFAAAARKLGFGATLTVDGTATATEIRWRKDGGAVVTTTSVVEGLSFAGVTIDRVINTVTSEAAGRPDTANASIRREFCGVVGPGIEERGCIDLDSEEARAFISGVSENILERRGLTLRVPQFDNELRQGTPKGAQAALQKDRFVSEGERLLNSDPRTTVAALEVVHTNDSPRNGRARQIYQLAGAEASTAYFISKRPPDFDFDFGGFDAPQQQFAAPAPVTIPGEEAVPPTPPRVLAESASSSPAPQPAPAIQGGPLEALSRGLEWLLRNPWEALKIGMLVFTAFGLPIHLHSRRRAFTTALVKEA